jgi:hypothetical protein
MILKRRPRDDVTLLLLDVTLSLIDVTAALSEGLNSIILCMLRCFGCIAARQ